MPEENAVAAAYDARADEYVALLGDVAQMDAADRTLIESWRDATPGALLDAGCGPGHWTALLSVGGRTAVGIELSPAFVASARERFPGIRFENTSFGELPFADASVGGILAWYSLIHTPPEEIPAVLAEFARALAPGGNILIGLFDGDPGAPFDHAITTAYFWSADAFAAMLTAAGFDLTATDHRSATSAQRPHLSLRARRV